jgi:MarR family transcriptional regulator, organic hydroperoxide resistance regulator
MSFSLDRSIGFVTNRLANRLKSELERGFSEHGYQITAEQWLVLGRLMEKEGIAQHELAGRLSKDKTNTARILALMERDGLIERRVDTLDSRVRKIYVTSQGRALHAKLVVIAQEVLNRAQQGLNEQDVDRLIDLMNQVFDNLR